MIGIIGALHVEVDILIAKLINVQKRTISGRDYYSGNLGGQDVVIVECGVGKVNAAMCAQTLILAYQPELVINTGVAGGLDGNLHIGDIAVARDLVQHDVDTTATGEPVGFVSTVDRIDFPCATWAVEKILEAVRSQADLKGALVRIASGDQFIERREDKMRIIKQFQAGACEMEGGAIAQVCWINNVDCAVIRAISDAMDGEHAMEFSQFCEMAAHNSSRVLMHFLENYEKLNVICL